MESIKLYDLNYLDKMITKAVRGDEFYKKELQEYISKLRNFDNPYVVKHIGEIGDLVKKKFGVSGIFRDKEIKTTSQWQNLAWYVTNHPLLSPSDAFNEVVTALGQGRKERDLMEIAQSLKKVIEHEMGDEELKKRLAIWGWGAGITGSLIKGIYEVFRHTPSRYLKALNLVSGALQSTAGLSLFAKVFKDLSAPIPPETAMTLGELLFGTGILISGLSTKVKIKPMDDLDFQLLKENAYLNRKVTELQKNLSRVQDLKTYEQFKPVLDTLSSETSSFPDFIVYPTMLREKVANMVNLMRDPEVVRILSNPSKIKELNLRRREFIEGGELKGLTDAEKTALYIRTAIDSKYLAGTFGRWSKHLEGFPDLQLRLILAKEGGVVEDIPFSLREIDLRKYIADPDSKTFYLGIWDDTWRGLQEKGQALQGFYEVDLIRGDESRKFYALRSLELRSDYVPTYARAYVVKGELGQGQVQTFLTNEYEIENVIQEIVAGGGSVKAIYGPSIRAVATKRFVREFAEKMAVTLEEKKPEEIYNILKESLKQELMDYFTVFQFKKKTEYGFLENLIKEVEKGDPSAISQMQNILIQDMYTKTFPLRIPVWELQRGIDTLASVTGNTKLRVYGDVLREATRPETSLFEKAQSFVKRNWLLLNVPIRLMNTVAIPFSLSARVLSNADVLGEEKAIRLAKEVFSEVLKGFAEIRPHQVLNEVTKNPVASFYDLLVSVSRAPFEVGVRQAARRIVQNEELVRALFPFQVKAEALEDFLTAFIFADTSLAKPSFFFQKLGGIQLNKAIDTISAFFTANYLPAYNSLLPAVKAAISPIYGQGSKYVAPFFVYLGLASAYAGLMGLKSAPLIGVLLQAEEGWRQIQNFFGEETQEFLTSEKFFNFVSSKLPFLSTLFEIDPTQRMIFHTIWGQGLLGYITGFRTSAGALAFPELLNSPLLQVVDEYRRQSEKIKPLLQRGVVSEAEQAGLALMKSAVRVSGAVSKFAQGFYQTWNNITYLEPKEFSGVLKELFFPVPRAIEEPPYINLYDKQALEKMRGNILTTADYIVRTLSKTDREGIQVFKHNLAKAIETQHRQILSYLKGDKRVSAKDAGDVENLLFLARLYTYLFQEDVRLSPEILRLHPSWESALAKMSHQFDIAKYVTEKFYTEIRNKMRREAVQR